MYFQITGNARWHIGVPNERTRRSIHDLQSSSSKVAVLAVTAVFSACGINIIMMGIAAMTGEMAFLSSGVYFMIAGLVLTLLTVGAVTLAKYRAARHEPNTINEAISIASDIRFQALTNATDLSLRFIGNDPVCKQAVDSYLERTELLVAKIKEESTRRIHADSRLTREETELWSTLRAQADFTANQLQAQAQLVQDMNSRAVQPVHQMILDDAQAQLPNWK